MPTIEGWEAALATRDTVFLQIAAMAVLAMLAVGGLFKIAAKLGRLIIGLAVLGLLGLLAFSVWNIYGWTP